MLLPNDVQDRKEKDPVEVWVFEAAEPGQAQDSDSDSGLPLASELQERRIFNRKRGDDKGEGEKEIVIDSQDAKSCERTTEASVTEKQLSYEQLQKATSNFSHSTMVVKHDMQIVHLAKLPRGKAAVIEQFTLKIDTKEEVGVEEIHARIAPICRLEHPNIIEVLGYCYASKVLLIAFDHLPNGTLEQHLYGRRTSSKGAEESLPGLNWEQRMKVALGSARGMEYLHHGTSKPIVHGQFHARNIFLDDHFNVKVGGFGLPWLSSSASFRRPQDGKELDEPLLELPSPDGACVSSKQLEEESPEPTMESDVYDYGVVLLQLITGQKPIDPTRPDGQQSLVEWVTPLLSEDLEKFSCVIDPSLDGIYSRKAMAKMACLAKRCLSQDPQERPSLRDIVAEVVDCHHRKFPSHILERPDIFSFLETTNHCEAETDSERIFRSWIAVA
ncbi:hypothetical protein CBR_g10787 [Chara braunii]|uniref:Protein kinase domain-containing protein n=1 Tax=Chara braunii TaxID=69332 RepID=A0A388KP68_CHABU|nr:hypothetical protein CBR_g10787 [Chara braunii]|eukprot:GBG71849.1 hypothetical protein CBR_g10787 [Chara braunii]